MKNSTPFIVVFVIILIIAALFLSLGTSQKMIVTKEGNTNRVPLEMELGKYQDSDCGMVIEDLEYASQVIAPSGKTWFFHDHGGFVNWLKDKEFREDAIIWVMSKDTKKWINAKSAFYSLDEKTPMGYGFGAYEVREARHVDFESMKLKMLRGETLNNPLIKKQLLGN